MINAKDLKIRILVTLGVIVLSIMYIFPLQDKINLGLDLKGGMYLVLKVDTSNVPEDEASQATEAALEVIRNRIDEFGVKEPSIQIQGKDSILIQLPGEVDRDRTLKLIGQTAFLEFNLVEEDSEKINRAVAGEVLKGYELKSFQDKPLLIKEEPAVTGADLVNANSSFDNSMFPIVTIKFNGRGTEKFAKVTRENVGRRLAILLDGTVKSTPTIQEPIVSGDAQITGNFTVQSAQDLALMLRAGALPCPLTVEEERTVGPLLGSDSIKRGINSIVIGSALVVLFMLIYYMAGGIVAFICILLDLLFILGGLSLLRATLTLPGIAGMILTLGMAVDSNVLIFERIREELALNKPLRLSVKNGFDRARRTIFDANITTLIAAVFLFIYGTGPIKGFATTLSLGIIASIFTAVFVGRTVLHLFLSTGMKRFSMLRLLRTPSFNFVRLKNICLVFSMVLMVVSVIGFKSRGDTIWGIDFSGGQVLQYKLDPPRDIQEVRRVLTDNGAEGLSLQEFKDVAGGVIIRSREDVTDKADKILKENFTRVTRLGIDTIGPAVGAILQKKAVMAVVFSLLGILLFIAVRFKHFDFAFAGVCALFHDVIISIGFLAFFNYEINLLTITALLTIAGYSINDTIVIYDRIRELWPKIHKTSLSQVINLAINQTVSRTIITSFTTILVVLCIFVLGGTALKGFSFTLLVGFIAGTYSSVFIAAPLVLLFHRFSLRRG